MKCPNCGNSIQDDAAFCDQCGARIDKPVETEQTAVAPAAPAPAQASAPAPAPVRQAPATVGSVCPSCGASNTPGEMFCAECGTPLDAPQPSPAVAQTPAPAPGAATPASEPGENRCPVCGAQLTGNDAFCFACGADINGQPPAAAARMPEAATSAPVAPVAETVTPAEPATSAESVAAPAAPEPGAPQPAAITECPACGAIAQPGDTFCDFCGAALVSGQAAAAVAEPSVAPAEPEVAVPQATPAQPAPQPSVAAPVAALAHLVIPDSGIELPITAQETLVGREDAISGIFPDIDLTPHGGEQGGVSRRHFKITQRGTQFLIEDLNSTNFTMVNRQRLQPGSPLALSDGDEVRAGRVHLVFKVS